MSARVEPQSDVASAWLATALLVEATGGHAPHVLTTLTTPPLRENPGIRGVMDEYLTDHHRGKLHIQSIETVAGTLFPSTFYKAPAASWLPNDPARTEELDRARQRMTQRYERILPTLRRFPANNRGTYFERMIAWPTPDGPVDQLGERITALRRSRQRNLRFFNVNDITLSSPDVDVMPITIHRATDRRLRGFPCLVHIDLSVVHGALHMLAVYRHQYLITKAYGNMLGLHRLHTFLAQQTGYPLGELCVQATYADLELRSGWGGQKVREMLRRAVEASRRLEGIA